MPERSWSISHPLDLRLTAFPLQHGNGDPTIKVSDRVLIRAARTPDGPASERIELSATGAHAQAWGPGAEWLLDKAPELLGGSDDISSFRPRHPAIRGLARSLSGLRLCRSNDVLGTLVPTILEQKVTGTGARRSYRGIVLRWGEPAPGPLGLRLPPDPCVLAGLPYFELHQLGVERKRAGILSYACSRATRLEEALGMDRAGATRRLQAIPGIGPWTSAIVMATAAGDPDAVCVGDFHVPNTVAWVLAGEARGTDERMLQLLAEFPGHRGRVIRLIGAGGRRAPRFGPRLPVEQIGAI
jgi:3-methyladenine DNA glycosylase/8-oxoguanine DNA glycosylase